MRERGDEQEKEEEDAHSELVEGTCREGGRESSPINHAGKGQCGLTRHAREAPRLNGRAFYGRGRPQAGISVIVVTSLVAVIIITSKKKKPILVPRRPKKNWVSVHVGLHNFYFHFMVYVYTHQ